MKCSPLNAVPPAHRKVLRYSASTFIAMLLQCAVGLAAIPEKKPNLLIVVTDDQGAWAVGHRDTRVITPNIDFLARHGVRFDNAIAPTPVCSAARASFFTGRTASQHGIHDFLSEDASSKDNWLEDEVLLSEVLAAGGYRVGLFGKWHADTQGYRSVRGFDEWLSYDEREAPWINQYLHTGTVHFSQNGEAIRHSGVQAQFLTSSALSFIEASPGDQPFAVFVNYVEPHFPFADLPERLVERYREPAREIVPFGDFSSVPSMSEERVSKEIHAEYVAQYLAAVTLVDEQLGRLIDGLVGSGRWDDTLLLFTSDHGHMTGQYGLYGKGNATVPQNLYELSLRIPFLIAGPAGLVQSGQIRDEAVNLMDVFPTLAALADVPIAGTYDGPGRNLVPLLRGEADVSWRDGFQFAEMGNARSVQRGRWKLVRYYDRDPARPPRDHWYDLASPIGERVAVAAPATSEEMSKALEAYFARYADPKKAGTRVWDLPRPNDREPWYGGPQP